MQTFLSETSFSASAEVLDKKRLQKQLLEGRQILDILVQNPNARWRNHPAVLMWKGHEYWLYRYLKRIKDECRYREIKVDKNWSVISELVSKLILTPGYDGQDSPIWWYDENLMHRVVTTHRARLYIKDPVHYKRYENYVEEAETLRCCSHCNYFWPSHWVANGNKFLVTKKKRSA